MVFLYRVGREKEFRIPDFEKTLLALMGVIETHFGKFRRGVYKYI